MEFKDSVVTPFNFDEIKDECFGGAKESDDPWFGFLKSGGYGKSGYVLVYEKRKKKPIMLLVNEKRPEQSPECTDTAPSRVHTNVDYSNYRGIPREIHQNPITKESYVSIPMNEIEIYVPNKLYKGVWEDNIDLFFERLIYSKEFYDFVKELMNGTKDLN